MIPVEHVYIHTPFCKKKCRYCDFYSVEADNRLLVTNFISALYKEIDFFNKGIGLISTVYFGGGTPSIMPHRFIPETIEKISKFGFWASPEITVEVNPESANVLLFELFRDAGVNRLSVGVQSLNDAHLEWLGRVHSSKKALSCVEKALKIFPKVSVDLIYGIPQQTIGEFKDTIGKLASMGVKHFSLYALTVEKENPLYDDIQRYYRNKRDEILAAFWESAAEKLKEFHIFPYEVSNFAQKDHQCIHNISYWTREYYAGFGPSAHSFLLMNSSSVRLANVKDVEKYVSILSRNENPACTKENLSIADDISEHILLSLRTSYGIHIKKFIKCFGEHIINKLVSSAVPLVDAGILKMSDERIFLENSKLLLADGVSAKIIYEMEKL